MTHQPLLHNLPYISRHTPVINEFHALYSRLLIQTLAKLHPREHICYIPMEKQKAAHTLTSHAHGRHVDGNSRPLTAEYPPVLRSTDESIFSSDVDQSTNISLSINHTGPKLPQENHTSMFSSRNGTHQEEINSSPTVMNVSRDGSSMYIFDTPDVTHTPLPIPSEAVPTSSTVFIPRVISARDEAYQEAVKLVSILAQTSLNPPSSVQPAVIPDPCSPVHTTVPQDSTNAPKPSRPSPSRARQRAMPLARQTHMHAHTQVASLAAVRSGDADGPQVSRAFSQSTEPSSLPTAPFVSSPNYTTIQPPSHLTFASGSHPSLPTLPAPTVPLPTHAYASSHQPVVPSTTAVDAAVRATMADYHGDLQASQRDLTHATERLHASEVRSNGLAAQNDQLRVQLEQSTAELLRLGERLQTLKHERRELKHRVAEMGAAVATARADGEEAVEGLQRALATERARADAAVQESERLSARLDMALQQAALHEAITASLHQQYDTLAAQRAADETRVSACEEALAACAREREAAETKAEEQVQTLHGRVNTLEEELHAARERERALEQRWHQSEGARAALAAAPISGVSSVAECNCLADSVDKCSCNSSALLDVRGAHAQSLPAHQQRPPELSPTATRFGASLYAGARTEDATSSIAVHVRHRAAPQDAPLRARSALVDGRQTVYSDDEDDVMDISDLLSAAYAPVHAQSTRTTERRTLPPCASSPPPNAPARSTFAAPPAHEAPEVRGEWEMGLSAIEVSRLQHACDTALAQRDALAEQLLSAREEALRARSEAQAVITRHHKYVLKLHGAHRAAVAMVGRFIAIHRSSSAAAVNVWRDLCRSSSRALARAPTPPCRVAERDQVENTEAGDTDACIPEHVPRRSEEANTPSLSSSDALQLIAQLDTRTAQSLQRLLQSARAALGQSPMNAGDGLKASARLMSVLQRMRLLQRAFPSLKSALEGGNSSASPPESSGCACPSCNSAPRHTLADPCVTCDACREERQHVSELGLDDSAVAAVYGDVDALYNGLGGEDDGGDAVDSGEQTLGTAVEVLGELVRIVDESSQKMLAGDTEVPRTFTPADNHVSSCMSAASVAHTVAYGCVARALAGVAGQLLRALEETRARLSQQAFPPAVTHRDTASLELTAALAQPTDPLLGNAAITDTPVSGAFPPAVSAQLELETLRSRVSLLQARLSAAEASLQVRDTHKQALEACRSDMAVLSDRAEAWHSAVEHAERAAADSAAECRELRALNLKLRGALNSGRECSKCALFEEYGADAARGVSGHVAITGASVNPPRDATINTASGSTPAAVPACAAPAACRCAACVDNAQEHIDTLKRQSAEHLRQLRAALVEVEALRGACAELSQAKQEHAETERRLRSGHTRTSAALQECKRELVRVQAQVNALQADIAEKDKRITSLKRLLAMREQRLEEADARLAADKQVHAREEGEVTALHQRIKQLQDSGARKDTSMKAIREKVAQLETQLSMARKETEELQSKLAAITDKHKRLSAECGSKDAQLAQAKEALCTLLGRLEEGRLGEDADDSDTESSDATAAPGKGGDHAKAGGGASTEPPCLRSRLADLERLINGLRARLARSRRRRHSLELELRLILNHNPLALRNIASRASALGFGLSDDKLSALSARMRRLAHGFGAAANAILALVAGEAVRGVCGVVLAESCATALPALHTVRQCSGLNALVLVESEGDSGKTPQQEPPHASDLSSLRHSESSNTEDAANGTVSALTAAITSGTSTPFSQFLEHAAALAPMAQEGVAADLIHSVKVACGVALPTITSTRGFLQCAEDTLIGVAEGSYTTNTLASASSFHALLAEVARYLRVALRLRGEEREIAVNASSVAPDSAPADIRMPTAARVRREVKGVGAVSASSAADAGMTDGYANPLYYPSTGLNSKLLAELHRIHSRFAPHVTTADHVSEPAVTSPHPSASAVHALMALLWFLTQAQPELDLAHADRGNHALYDAAVLAATRQHPDTASILAVPYPPPPIDAPVSVHVSSSLAHALWHVPSAALAFNPTHADVGLTGADVLLHNAVHKYSWQDASVRALLRSLELMGVDTSDELDTTDASGGDKERAATTTLTAVAASPFPPAFSPALPTHVRGLLASQRDVSVLADLLACTAHSRADVNITASIFQRVCGEAADGGLRSDGTNVSVLCADGQWLRLPVDLREYAARDPLGYDWRTELARVGGAEAAQLADGYRSGGVTEGTSFATVFAPSPALHSWYAVATRLLGRARISAHVMHALLATAQVRLVGAEARVERLVAQHSEEVHTMQSQASEEAKALHLCISRYRHACAKLHALVRGCGACEGKYKLRVRESERMLIDDCEEAWVEANVAASSSTDSSITGAYGDSALTGAPRSTDVARDSHHHSGSPRSVHSAVRADDDDGVCQCTIEDDTAHERWCPANVTIESLAAHDRPSMPAKSIVTRSGQVLRPTGTTLRMMQTDFEWNDKAAEDPLPGPRTARPLPHTKATPVSIMMLGAEHQRVHPLSAPPIHSACACTPPCRGRCFTTEDLNSVECSALAEGLNTPGYVQTRVTVHVQGAQHSHDSQVIKASQNTSGHASLSMAVRGSAEKTGVADADDELLSMLNPNITDISHRVAADTPRDRAHPASPPIRTEPAAMELSATPPASAFSATSPAAASAVISPRATSMDESAVTDATLVSSASASRAPSASPSRGSASGYSHGYDYSADASYAITLSDAAMSVAPSVPASAPTAHGPPTTTGPSVPATALVAMPQPLPPQPPPALLVEAVGARGITPPLTPLSPQFQLKVCLPRGQM